MHTITIPGYLPPRLNQLLRRHWSFRRRAQKEADGLVSAYALQAGVPRARTKRRVSLVFRSPRTAADPDARLKLLLDALVHAGLLVDDSPAWCDLGPVRAEKGPRAVLVTLEDVT